MLLRRLRESFLLFRLAFDAPEVVRRDPALNVEAVEGDPVDRDAANKRSLYSCGKRKQFGACKRESIFRLDKDSL